MPSLDQFAAMLQITRGAAGAARLATILDQEMLDSRGVTIASRATVDEALPLKSGSDVYGELGGRYLIRYLLTESIIGAAAGMADPTYVTPTPYTPTDAVDMLMLPAEDRQREHAMLIDPRKVAVIAGPRWVQGGFGIEYILPKGYPKGAIALRPWSIRLG